MERPKTSMACPYSLGRSKSNAKVRFIYRINVCYLQKSSNIPQLTYVSFSIVVSENTSDVYDKLSIRIEHFTKLKSNYTKHEAEQMMVSTIFLTIIDILQLHL